MARSKRTVRKEYTPREIARFVRLIRKMLGIHNRTTFNLLLVFEYLKKIFPLLEIQVVEDSDPELGGAEARAYPESWLIKISRGVHEGLLRGYYGARWTFAHELGHVLLQHPGRPPRDRSSERDLLLVEGSTVRERSAFLNRKRSNADVIEDQAHNFAAEFLAHTDLANSYSIEEIGPVFNISNKAARQWFWQMALEKTSRQFGTKRRPSQNPSESVRLEDHAAIICEAISVTIREQAVSSNILLQPLKNNLFSASVLSSKAAEFLLIAYESARGTGSHDDLAIAASLAAAILTIKPIRQIVTTKAIEIPELNLLCALRSSATLLGVKISDQDIKFATKNDDAPAIAFRGEYLRGLIAFGERSIAGPTTVLHLRELPSYNDYNGDNDISWSEVHQLEVIMKVLALMRS
jgi:hypothetical protein